MASSTYDSLRPGAFHYHSTKKRNFRLCLTEIHLPLSLRLEVGDEFRRKIKKNPCKGFWLAYNVHLHAIDKPCSVPLYYKR